jgi:hypothetical protein
MRWSSRSLGVRLSALHDICIRQMHSIIVHEATSSSQVLAAKPAACGHLLLIKPLCKMVHLWVAQVDVNVRHECSDQLWRDTPHICSQDLSYATTSAHPAAFNDECQQHIQSIL